MNYDLHGKKIRLTCGSGRVVVNVGQTLTSLIFFYMLSTGLDFLCFLKCDNFLRYVDMRKAGTLDWLLFTERPGSGWRLSQTPPAPGGDAGVRAEEPRERRTVRNCRERLHFSTLSPIETNGQLP